MVQQKNVRKIDEIICCPKYFINIKRSKYVEDEKDKETNKRLAKILNTNNSLSFLDNIGSYGNFRKNLNNIFEGILIKNEFDKIPKIIPLFIPYRDKSEPEICFGMFFIDYDVAFIHYFLNYLVSKYSNVLSEDDIGKIDLIKPFFNISKNNMWIPKVQKIDYCYSNYSSIHYQCSNKQDNINNLLDINIFFNNRQYNAVYHFLDNDYTMLFSLKYTVDTFHFDITLNNGNKIEIKL